MTQDTHQQAKERFEDARDSVAEQYSRMREDLRFSDPTNPQQWDKTAQDLRKGRPCLTFDRTNQFIAQVVNAGRQSKPSIHCMPADGKADIAVAEKLNGMFRHIEYVSRAGIAYDTALENAARCGLGWFMVVPEIMRAETNEQELRIKRLLDPTAAYLEAGWTEPDGSDATHGFVESLMTETAYKAKWPKAGSQGWEGAGDWYADKMVRVCDYWCIHETKSNRIKVSLEGQSKTFTEDEYHALSQQIGMALPVESTYMATVKKVKWYQLSGAEVLDETDFPGEYVPLIPIIGHEIWVDGKRRLGGMTRRLMDSQRAYNYERSAFIESVAMQPKAPIMAPAEAMEGLDNHWAALNQGNPTFLPWNHLDSNGNPIPQPERLQPPTYPIAFAQGGQIATADMEASVGMFKPTLGQQSNAVSGRAKREDKESGDTANFHYIDNRNRSIERLGLVALSMMPTIYDQPRMARIMGEDGEQEFVHVNPQMPQAVQKQGKKVVAINPGVGTYDVRVKAGPAYTTLREEQAEQLAHIMQAAPTTVPLLADLWVGAQDMPDGDKVRKRLAAMLPPQIQQMEQDEGPDMPPEALAQIGALQQENAQLKQLAQAAEKEIQTLDQKVLSRDNETAVKATTEHAKAEYERMKLDLETRKAEAEARARQSEVQIAAYQAETARLAATFAAENAARQADLAEKTAEQAEKTPTEVG